MATVHVKYAGNSHTIDFDELFPAERYTAIGIPAGTDVSPSTVTDQHVKTALAQHFDVALDEFEALFVEFNPNGNITVRPEAVFG